MMKRRALFLLTFGLLSFTSAYAEKASEWLDTLAADNAEFAFDLYHQLQTHEGNLVFSPYSISTALAMTYGGARGITEDEMAAVLHFTLPQERIHAAFHELIAEVEGNRTSEELELRTANALWRQHGYSFLDSYLQLLEQHYEATPFVADFVHRAEQARLAINEWVEEQTGGKIVDLIAPGILTPATTLVLCNAVYFRGLWAYQFDPEQTSDGEFSLPLGETIRTPMMRQMAHLRLARLDGSSALELPYVDDQLAMVLILPDRPDGIRSLEDELSGEKAAAWLSLLFDIDPRPVLLCMPKFNGTSRFELAETLAAMGMPHAFHGADFSGMTGDYDLFISNVIHQAYIEVHEAGTEAAASTAVVMKRGRIDEFVVDRPFLFLIVDKKTGSILFLGRIMDPSA
jgi:serpin B